MEPTSKPKVKICCISSVGEARLAVRYGASAVGLVSAMPSGPGVIADGLIAQIAATIPPEVLSVLLTSQQDVAAIVAQQRQSRVRALQICDRLPMGHHRELRAALPETMLIQVIQVTGPEAVPDAVAVAPYVDALLLDSGNQSLAVKELGGTGRIHDWMVSKRIRELVAVPVFLAGGLNAANVAEAIRLVGPAWVDVCTGVRTNGALDEGKLGGFCRML